MKSRKIKIVSEATPSYPFWVAEILCNDKNGIEKKLHVEVWSIESMFERKFPDKHADLVDKSYSYMNCNSAE